MTFTYQGRTTSEYTGRDKGFKGIKDIKGVKGLKKRGDVYTW